MKNILLLFLFVNVVSAQTHRLITRSTTNGNEVVVSVIKESRSLVSRTTNALPAVSTPVVAFSPAGIPPSLPPSAFIPVDYVPPPLPMKYYAPVPDYDYPNLTDFKASALQPAQHILYFYFSDQPCGGQMIAIWDATAQDQWVIVEAAVDPTIHPHGFIRARAVQVEGFAVAGTTKQPTLPAGIRIKRLGPVKSLRNASIAQQVMPPSLPGL